ncbi:MAG: two-component sensor histidine kinase [Firmicutes bacterium]|nr:two-component sensor histidine kinase [Bacillota bacterium]
MIKTIFRNAFLIGISVLLICGLLFFGIQYRQIQDTNLAELRLEAEYAAKGLMNSGEDYLKTLSDVNRITWIAKDGTVLFDNMISLPMDPQNACPEVAGALQQGEGESIRTSDSSGKSMMYYALRCSDGTILRLSRPLSVTRSALLAVSPVLWVLVLVLLISAVLSLRMAQQIVRPINDLDLENPNRHIYPELTPLVDKLLEQNLAIQEEVAQREDLRREFSANVSHELKTPLTSISGFAELMSEGVVSGEKMQEFSSDIYRESQRLISLIDDIIKLSRLDEDAEGPQKETVDLYELSSGVLDSLRKIAEKQNVDLYLTGGPAAVSGIYRLLYEMIYNLCDNAIKYNRPGGKVTVNTVTEDDRVILTVSDTGIGIPPEHQKRVFERFYRVDKSHSKSVGGTGLGLSIVKHGAQFHDAEIQLESEPDSGTVMTLTFPAVAHDESSSGSAPV